MLVAGSFNENLCRHRMDLIADHISHRFGALEVLHDVSFTVGAGEVVAIVGPSGCGKSTLLSILGGLLQSSAGKAELRGAPPPDSFNPLTFVFQDFALLPWSTVEANVEFPLLHTQLTAAGRRAQRYDGTDRQCRGRLLAVVRDGGWPVTQADLDVVWPDPAQLARALDGLVTEGLVDPLPDGRFALPGTDPAAPARLPGAPRPPQPTASL